MGTENEQEAPLGILATCFCVWVVVACEVDAAKFDGSTNDQDATQFSARIELPGFRLRFKDGASAFKIAIFADLHYGENAWDDWGPRQDVNSTRVQSFLLNRESPAIGPAVEMDIPFASVFGNHDDAPFEWDPHSGVPLDAPKQTTSRKELMEFDTSLPSSFSLEGPTTLWPSVSNYVIPITSSGGTITVAIMYFLDSGGGSMSEDISAHQAAWFTATASEINPDASIPELVFWHIPSIAYTQAGPGANIPIEAPCVGSINDERIAPQETEGGIMNVLLTRKSVKVFWQSL